MPTYTSPQDGTTLDTYIKSGGHASYNYSTEVDLRVGDSSTDIYTNRGLIQFPDIPKGGGIVVNSAKLYVKIEEDNSNNARTLRVYRILRDTVISQVTWNSWKTGSNWSTAGAYGSGDSDTSDIGSLSFTASESVGAWKVITLSNSAIQEFVNGSLGTADLTLLLKMDTETDDRYDFHSSNATTSANRPYLVVEYMLGGQVIIWTSE